MCIPWFLSLYLTLMPNMLIHENRKRNVQPLLPTAMTVSCVCRNSITRCLSDSLLINLNHMSETGIARHWMDERTNMTTSSRGITVVFHHIDIVNVTTEVFSHDNCLMPHINFIILSAQVEKKMLHSSNNTFNPNFKNGWCRKYSIILLK